MTDILPYDAARALLAKARTFDDVKDMHDKAEAMRIYARRACETDLEQNAAEIRMRAKRRFGEMAIELKAAGGLRVGNPSFRNGNSEEPLRTLAKLADLGITKKFSSQAQKAAGIAEQAFEALVQSTRDRIAHGRSGANPIANAGAAAPTREEAIDSLDFFPTPPWASRALPQHVLPRLGLIGRTFDSVWEPACGEGHMAEVLREYSLDVVATDVFDYGYPKPGLPLVDFLTAPPSASIHDWIITNPPFTGDEDRALAFALRALSLARVGVAMFVRSQWLVEGVDRYDSLIHNNPPTLCAFFTERVPIHKGRWDPTGGTMTAYSWVVWLRGATPQAPFWIPPYCRATLTKPDDVERFTAHPVRPAAIDHDPQTGEILATKCSEAA